MSRESRQKTPVQHGDLEMQVGADEVWKQVCYNWGPPHSGQSMNAEWRRDRRRFVGTHPSTKSATNLNKVQSSEVEEGGARRKQRDCLEDRLLFL